MASFLRTNILRRGGGGEGGSGAAGDSSAGPAPSTRQREMQERRLEAGEREGERRARGRAVGLPLFGRRFVPALFAGRMARDADRRGDPARNDDRFDDDDGPKTPRLDQHHHHHQQGVPPSRTSRAWTRGSSRLSEGGITSPPPPSRGTASSTSSPRSSVNTAQAPGLATPPAVAALRFSNHNNHGYDGRRTSSVVRAPSVASSRRSRRFEGADPAELHLAALADSGRRRQQRGRREGSLRTYSSRRGRTRDDGDDDGRPASSGSAGSSSSERSRRFLCCFPWPESVRLRAQILKCFVSGLFMLTLLSVYLALSMTHQIRSHTFTILLILMILFTTIIFCHGLVRICMLLMRPAGDRDRDHGGRHDAERNYAILPVNREMADAVAGGGYAVPRRPIRVVLARDEEAAGLSEAGAAKLNPPAYGAWRESVRIDPNRFFWARNEQAGASSSSSSSSSEAGSDSRPGTANRPPSYASEDGVGYVVDARPRSFAPPPPGAAAARPSESSGASPERPGGDGMLRPGASR